LPFNVTHGIASFIHIEEVARLIAMLPIELLKHSVEGLYLVGVDPIDVCALATLSISTLDGWVLSIELAPPWHAKQVDFRGGCSNSFWEVEDICLIGELEDLLGGRGTSGGGLSFDVMYNT
jgi:hypothetical protein